MSQLTIAFDDHTRNAFRAVVPVEVFDEHLKLVTSVVVRLPDIPTVEVGSPGLYAVRAELPTGEHLATTVRVGAEAKPAVARLVAEEASPRETLAWAYAQQSVRNMSGRTRSHPTPAFEWAATALSVRITGIFQQRGPGWTLAPINLSLEEDVDVARQDWRLITRFSVSSSSVYDWIAVQAPLYVRYAVSAMPLQPESLSIVAVPARDAEILFVRGDAEPGTAEGVRPLVRGARPEAESLLAYMRHGAFQPARRIGQQVIEEAVQVLREKRDDPFGAAIAGYFLLATERQPRADWLRNLAEWFPKIPDGAVIYASSHLRHDDRDQARTYFLEAVNRGIPTYTAGLRILFDGLRALAEMRPDEQLLRALAQVRQVAAYTDWTAQTTTFEMPPLGTATPVAFPMPTFAGFGTVAPDTVQT